MLPEYDFTGKKGARGKYYRAYRQGHMVKSADVVNTALRVVVTVRAQDIVNIFKHTCYLGEGSQHREHYQGALRRANSGLSRTTVSGMS